MSPLYTAEEREDIERLRKSRYSTWLSASQCAFDALFELGHRACIRAWRAKCERKYREGYERGLRKAYDLVDERGNDCDCAGVLARALEASRGE